MYSYACFPMHEYVWICVNWKLNAILELLRISLFTSISVSWNKFYPHIMPFIKSPLISSNCLLLVLSYQHLLQNVNSVELKASLVFSDSWCQSLLCGVSKPFDLTDVMLCRFMLGFLFVVLPSYFHTLQSHWSAVLSWGGLFFPNEVQWFVVLCLLGLL